MPIVSGEDWQRMLKVAAKFHNYSFNNQLMIFLQRPDATWSAGFNKWKSLGRFVKKGEKGLAIFAPCKYKTKVEDDDGNEKTFSRSEASGWCTFSISPRPKAKSFRTSTRCAQSC